MPEQGFSEDHEPAAASTFDLVGPFDAYRVTVEGREVPYLAGHPMPDGGVDLSLDKRYGLQLTADEARRVVPFLADAIAIGMGFTCHPRGDWDGPIQRNHFPRLVGITGFEVETIGGEHDGERHWVDPSDEEQGEHL